MLIRHWIIEPNWIWTELNSHNDMVFNLPTYRSHSPGRESRETRWDSVSGSPMWKSMSAREWVSTGKLPYPNDGIRYLQYPMLTVGHRELFLEESTEAPGFRIGATDDLQLENYVLKIKDQYHQPSCDVNDDKTKAT